MFRVEVKGIGSFDQDIKDIEIYWEDIKTGLKLETKAGHKFMIDYIRSHTTRKAKNMRNSTPLTKAIDYEEIDQGFRLTISIGDIEKLMIDSPHWRIINFGGKHPMAGKFVPGEPAKKGKKTFTYSPFSGSGMMIGKDTRIAPMNYIQKTEVDLNRRYDLLINTIRIRNV